MLFLFFLRVKRVVAECRESAADSGSHDEYPNVLEGVTACEESGSEGTGGVDGSAGKTDAEDVYENQCETDNETCEGAVACLGRCNTEDCKNEDECQNDFYDKSCESVTVNAGKTVGTETACLVFNAALVKD